MDESTDNTQAINIQPTETVDNVVVGDSATGKSGRMQIRLVVDDEVKEEIKVECPESKQCQSVSTDNGPDKTISNEAPEQHAAPNEPVSPAPNVSSKDSSPSDERNSAAQLPQELDDKTETVSALHDLSLIHI